MIIGIYLELSKMKSFVVIGFSKLRGALCAPFKSAKSVQE